MTDEISEEEFALVQQQLPLFAKLVQGLDLAGFVNACDRADSIGPILDPTLWMRGNRQMNEMKKLAEALLGFQTEAERHLTAAARGTK